MADNNNDLKIILPINVTGVDEVKQAKGEVDKLNDSLDEAGKKDIGAGQVKSFKQQLKEATQEAQRLALAGRQNTEEYRQALQTVAELRDTQDELNRSLSAFDPGNKFQAISKFASTGAEAIGGVIGATELLGISSSTAEEAIKKMMAIQSIVSMIDAFGDLNDYVKAFTLRMGGAAAATNVQTVAMEGQAVATETATVATNGLGLAFKMLGIGLIVAAIALLVTKFDDIKAAVYKFIPGLKSVGEFFTKVTQSVTDFIGVTSEATRALDKLTAATTKNNAAIDNGIKLLETQGGKESKIYDLKKKRIEGELNLLREKLKVEKTLSSEEQKQFKDLKLNLDILDIAEKKRLADKAKTDAEKAKKDAEEAKKKQLEKEFAGRKDIKQSSNAKDVEVKDAIGNTIVQPLDTLNAQLSLESALKNKWDTIDTENARAQQLTRIELAEKEAEVKKQQIQEVSSAVDAAASLFSENTIAFKSLASANALINAYAGINEILAAKSTLPEPFGSIQKAISAAAIGANAFKQVKAINAVQIKGKSGVGTSAPSISAPVINSTILQRNATGSNDIVSAVNSKNDTPIRAYIVSKDLEKQQTKQDYYKNQSTI